MAIAHTQIEAIKSPSITALTMMWADQNKPKIDRSEEVSGKADCATSAGFMAQVLSADRLVATGGAIAGHDRGPRGIAGCIAPVPSHSLIARSTPPALGSLISPLCSPTSVTPPSSP